MVTGVNTVVESASPRLYAGTRRKPTTRSSPLEETSDADPQSRFPIRHVNRTVSRKSVAAAVLLLVVFVIVAAGKPIARQASDAWPQRTAPGAVDVGFAQSMIEHHQQAIVMAKLLLDGRPTPLRAMAQSIADSQLVELGEMRGWLSLWDRPLVATQLSMGWMLLGSSPPDAQLDAYLFDCRQSPTGMVGLATDEALEQLRQLEGIERDRHFLKLMLAHHQGAVPMARFAAGEARLAAVRDLATRIAYEQSEEIGRLDLSLAALDRASQAALNEQQKN